MGKFANQANRNQFRPLETAPEPDEPEYEPPLTEEERAAQWDSDDFWTRKDDATADELAKARRVYVVPVRHVVLFDECGVGI